MQYKCGETTLELEKESVVVLGNFDGVHKGHQKLLQEAKRLAKEKHLLAVALSFYPHPTWVLGNQPKPLVMSRQDRKHRIKEEGMDVFIEYPFNNAFASISPEQFFKEVLLDKLHVHAIVIGSNYFFGKGKTGNVACMRALGEKYDVEIIVVDTVKIEGEVISSTHIRRLISEGKMEESKELLGHPYTVVGTVVHGRKIGRTIGFPTLNMIADPDRIHPPNGVYATTVKVYNHQYMGITNVGYNPTVGGSMKMIETHLMDFEGDLYGAEIEVSFHRFIRAERKFENIEALSRQIATDTEQVRIFLRNMQK
ncbi:MAG: bifunctional riboflavin kinase/FAD synthetase [Niameybacter sp.]|uniref:bifunctional riboflavin kinase/FAD synthetase n=1 Tax=Niameybacter sp. TaxID=2033640 RepID=UPI002FC6D4FB